MYTVHIIKIKCQQIITCNVGTKKKLSTFCCCLYLLLLSLFCFVEIFNHRVCIYISIYCCRDYVVELLFTSIFPDTSFVALLALIDIMPETGISNTSLLVQISYITKCITLTSQPAVVVESSEPAKVIQCKSTVLV